MIVIFNKKKARNLFLRKWVPNSHTIFLRNQFLETEARIQFKLYDSKQALRSALGSFSGANGRIGYFWYCSHLFISVFLSTLHSPGCTKLNLVTAWFHYVSNEILGREPCCLKRRVDQLQTVQSCGDKQACASYRLHLI
jgi:hypothetical protein